MASRDSTRRNPYVDREVRAFVDPALRTLTPGGEKGDREIEVHSHWSLAGSVAENNGRII